jgi:hypothetical protein
MIHRLTDYQTQTRLKNQAISEKNKGIVMKDKSKRLMGMNLYISQTITRRSANDLRAFLVFTALANRNLV